MLPVRERERDEERNVLELISEFSHFLNHSGMAHEIIAKHWARCVPISKAHLCGIGTSQFTPKKLNLRREKIEKNKRSFPLRRRDSSFGHAKVPSCKAIGLIAADGNINT